MRLRDGRLLAYAEYGDPEGKPLLHFHGWAGSRLDFRSNKSRARSLGARVIGIDRPGVGLSDFQPGRELLDWPDDVAELADALGIDRFAVSGWSLGGPYAAACAFKIPDRLTSAGIIGGLAPLDRPGGLEGMSRLRRITAHLTRRVPCLVRPLVWQTSLLERANRRGTLRPPSFLIPKPDRALLSDATVRAQLAANKAEMFRRGNRGAHWDAVVVARRWGFRLQDVRASVHVWHGEADHNAPVQMGRYYAGTIPNCRATYYPGEGHLIFISRIDDILETLLG